MKHNYCIHCQFCNPDRKNEKDKLDVQGIRGLYIQWILRVMVFCQKNRKYFGDFMMQLQGEKTMAEKEYIDRGALMERLDRKKSTITTQRYVEGFNDAIMRFRSMVHSAPAADVVEVRHGEWEKASEFMPIYRCSICKERNLFKNGDNVFSNYCPHCGAKMDGGENDV